MRITIQTIYCKCGLSESPYTRIPNHRVNRKSKKIPQSLRELLMKASFNGRSENDRFYFLGIQLAPCGSKWPFEVTDLAPDGSKWIIAFMSSASAESGWLVAGELGCWPNLARPDALLSSFSSDEHNLTLVELSFEVDSLLGGTDSCAGGCNSHLLESGAGLGDGPLGGNGGGNSNPRESEPDLGDILGGSGG